MSQGFQKTESGSITSVNTGYVACVLFIILFMAISHESHAKSFYDFGDAPDSYSTTAASNGVSHKISPFYLGSTVDSETDGQPSMDASADGNDEDGVTFTSEIVGGQTATLNVVASRAGFLNAWMDFTVDGNWADANDQIFIDLRLDAGLNSIFFETPLTATAGTSYARFRFSNSQELSYSDDAGKGEAPNGEVEDYQVTIHRVQIAQVAQIPEPSHLALLGFALIGIGFRRKKTS